MRCRSNSSKSLSCMILVGSKRHFFQPIIQVSAVITPEHQKVPSRKAPFNHPNASAPVSAGSFGRGEPAKPHRCKARAVLASMLLRQAAGAWRHESPSSCPPLSRYVLMPQPRVKQREVPEKLKQGALANNADSCIAAVHRRYFTRLGRTAYLRASTLLLLLSHVL